MRNDKYIAGQLAINLKEHFYLVVDEYSDPLYRYAYRLVQGSAEDVVQDVFMLAFAALQTYPVERIMAMSLGPWLYRITKNRCLRWLEQRKRVPVQVPLDAVGIEEENERLQRARRRKEAEDAIGELPLLYREVFFLRFVEDLTIADIARRLGKPTGTIKSIISRGKKLLREESGDFFEEDH